MQGLQQLLSAVALMIVGVAGQHGGYHYNSFSGPVSGEARQIQVPVGVATHNHPAHNLGQTVDYVAKPDYTFAYGVEDPHTGNTQKHKESRDGDVVRGQYIVLQPDGSMRTVTYTADDENGFQATVHNTAPTIPQPQFALHPTPQHNNHNNNHNKQKQYNNYDY